jgi:hypothetical protein
MLMDYTDTEPKNIKEQLYETKLFYIKTMGPATQLIFSIILVLVAILNTFTAYTLDFTNFIAFIHLISILPL